MAACRQCERFQRIIGRLIGVGWTAECCCVEMNLRNSPVNWRYFFSVNELTAHRVANGLGAANVFKWMATVCAGEVKWKILGNECLVGSWKNLVENKWGTHARASADAHRCTGTKRKLGPRTSSGLVQWSNTKMAANPRLFGLSWLLAALFLNKKKSEENRKCARIGPFLELFFWEIFGRSFSEWKPMSNFLLLDENEIH